MLLGLWLLRSLSFVSGLSINVPTNPFSGTTVSVTWTFEPNDSASFVLDLHASLLSLDIDLETVNTTAERADVNLPLNQHGKGWTLRALDVTDNQEVLAESPQFSITAGPAPTVSTSSMPISSPSITPTSSSGDPVITSAALPSGGSSGLGGATQATAIPQNKSSNTGAIAGAVIGALVALGLLVFITVFLVLRRRRKTQATPTPFSPSVPALGEPIEVEGRLVEAPQLRQVVRPEELNTVVSGTASSFTESNSNKAGDLEETRYTVARLKAENARLNNLLRRGEGSGLEQPPSYDVASSSS